MKKLILLSLLLSSFPLEAHTNIFRQETCYKKIVQEEYVPPHRSNYGEGYINRYYNKVQVPCGVVHHNKHIEKPVAYQGKKISKCTGNSSLGALLGGGLSAIMSKKDAYGWTIPLGTVLGAGIGISGCH